MAMKDVELEIKLLLEAVYQRYQYDFRDYALGSIERRMTQALRRLGCTTISGLQERVMHDPTAFPVLLGYLTVPLSEMFRDPTYFKAIREQVVPVLETYPSIRIWVAGCSTGEEVYSFAILLAEEGLLARSLIYATDINPESLAKAEAGIYGLDRFQKFTENHRLAGGKGSLSEHYRAAYGSAVLDKALRRRVVFSDHSLTTDSVFAEMQLVSCRNVLIYFNRELQDRVVTLLRDSLCHRGFLGIGRQESLRFTRHAAEFSELCPGARISEHIDRSKRVSGLSGRYDRG
jgi:chemotaxis protein methyltransferase CheR